MGLTPMPPRQRLDLWLVDHGLAESREKAQALVMAGRVTVDGVAAQKPGDPVKPDAVIQVAPGPEHVGRGAVKLAGALDTLSVSPADRVAVDVGASTGGFTETLLARGALRVYAVDVGYGQLHERLSADPRVVVVDRLNARELSPRDVPEACGFATVDVSFISVLKILPALRSVLTADGDALVLVKPQFEVGRFRVGRGGVVKDPALHRQAVHDVAWAAQNEIGYRVCAACPSPITGAEGNREFFLHLRRDGDALNPGALEALIVRTVDA